MGEKCRVLLYTIEYVREKAEAYLAARGVADRFDLVSVTHEPYSLPALEELAGASAVLGEFMPVQGDAVDRFADAGVRLVASMSIGLNHVDVAGLAARGVLTANCPGYCAEEVATHALALMLDLVRQVTASNRRVLSGSWDPKAGYEMRRVSGLTCGLVFFGGIARTLAPLLQALGMRVLVWAPTKSAEELAQAGCEKVDTLDELLSRSDVVSLHCPLLPQTERLIGARELSLMKSTALLVNTARGAVVDEGALADALETGAIQAAALDVLTDETHPNERLLRAPNCIVTPHSAYVSREADEALLHMSLDSVIELLVDGRVPTHVARG